MLRFWLGCVIGSIAGAACLSVPDASAESCEQGELRACDCPEDPGGGIRTCVEPDQGFGPCQCEVGTGTDVSTGGTTMTQSSSGPGTTSSTSTTGPGSTSEAGSTGVPADRVYLYTTPEMYDGDLASLDGALSVGQTVDSLCRQAGQDLGLACGAYAAVMELPGERPVLGIADVFGLPGDAEVWAPEAMLAERLSDLLSPSNQLLVAPQMAGFAAGEYWTGAPAELTGDYQTCEGWTTADDATGGGVGDPAFTDLRWVASREAGCGEMAHLLCACW